MDKTKEYAPDKKHGGYNPEKQRDHGRKHDHGRSHKPKKEKGLSSFAVTMQRLKRDKLAVGGLIVILVLLLMGFIMPFFCRYDYKAVDPLNACMKPCLEHLFGTDQVGRDIFARCMMGARYSLLLGFSSELTGVFIGVCLGGISGYFGGQVDNIVMRCCDLFQSIPNILMTVILSAALSPGYFSTVIALAISGIPGNARMMRAQILSIREMQYVEGAKAITVPSWKIIFKYMVPNGWAPIIVGTTMGIGGKIQTAAGLSYLGLGVQPPTPEWGAMLSDATAQLRYNPYMLVIPGLFIMLTTFAFNLFGEGLRDASDPKLRQ